MSTNNRIVAAGAVVTRAGEQETEYLLVHRNLRDDWSFPKGKVDPGENLVGAAIREVREETGYAIQVGLPLPTQHYQVKGNNKDSYYWHAKVLGGQFVPNDEVDEIRWATFSQAQTLLTYPHDAEVLQAASQARPSVPLIILRHTQAMKRVEWAASPKGSKAPDSSRPLTAVGRMQANTLVSALAAFGVHHVHSSDSSRCRDTVGPYATARSLSVTLEPTVSEERHLESPEAAKDRVAQIAQISNPLVLCTHRPVLPSVMSALNEIFTVEQFGKHDFDPALTPGSMVVFHRDVEDLNRILKVERHIH